MSIMQQARVFHSASRRATSFAQKVDLVDLVRLVMLTVKHKKIPFLNINLNNT